MLELIQEKLRQYGLSTSTQLALLLFSAALVSTFVILTNRESRELLKDCKNRIF